MNTRNKRTLSKYIGYGLYLYFSGLSVRKASERLSIFIKRNPFPYGTGFKSTNLKGYQQEEE